LSTRSMTKVAGWLAVAVAVAPYSPAVAQQKPLRVGVAFTIPVAYVTPEGQPAGFYVEVFREAARREGLEVRFDVDRLSPDRYLSEGGGDIWVAAVPSASRRARFYVSEPWWILDTYLATMASSGIRSQTDLAGKTVLWGGSPPFSRPVAEFLPGARLREESNVEGRLSALCRGDVAAFVFYENSVHGLLGSSEFLECRERGIRIIPFDRPVRQLSIMANRSSQPAAERLLARIKEMKQDGSFERLPSFSLTGNELWKSEIAAERAQQTQLLWQIGTAFAAILLAGGVFAYTGLRNANRELKRALRSEQEATRAKSEFLAVMSHEIRTPMTAVLGYIDLLLATPLRPDQQQFAREVTQATQSLLSMLSDILDYSQSAGGKLQLSAEPFDPAVIVDDCVVAVQIQAEDKRIGLICEVDPSVPGQLRGDAGRLRHMILNLLNNAVKFTATGSVSVRVAYAPENDTEGSLRVTVADTGVGIPEDKQQRIFLPFTQLDSTHTRTQGGIGLGLAIVSNLCSQMRGRISVESQEGSGSTFVLELPASRDAGTASWLPCLRGERPLAGKAVAFWREDQPQLETVHRYLSASCFQVESAGSIGEFLRMATALAHAGIESGLHEGQPRLLLVDGERCTDHEMDQILSWKDSEPAACGRTMVLLGSLSYLRQCSENAKKLPDVVLTLPAPARAFRDLLRQRATAELGFVAAPAGTDLGRRVLVVDDNAVNRRVLGALLQRLGCEVEMAGNGAEAVAKIRDGGYGLVLMDCQMPIMNGFEATRQIRGELRSPVPIWGVSAALENEVRQQCLDCGMDDYLSKPITIEAGSVQSFV
jgi:signal transduction histidine kinase